MNMREMKDSGIEWIGTIPDNWDIMPNKYLMWKKKRICPVYNGEDIISLSMNGVIVRDLDAGGKMPTSFDGYQYIESGNLLMCLFDIDVTPRCIGLIKCNGLTSPAYSQFVLTNRANAGYYNYYYTMLDNDKTLVHLAKNLRHSLTEEQLGTISTIVPPIDEQIKISNYLDKKCEEINSVVAQLQEEIETLEEYKRSVITEAVTKGLDPDVEMRDSGVQWIGEIPTHWTLIRIGSLYGLRTQKVSDIDYPPLSVTKMGVLPQLDTVAKTNAHDDRKLVVKGDFVINSRSDRRGSCGISDYTGSVSLINTVLFPITEMNPRYYNWYFHTVGFADEFYRWGHGIVDDLWTTGWQNMKNILISVPPLDEQQRIADYLDSKCAEIDNIITEKKQQIETIEEYKKSLIFEYVTGKKEVA